MTRIAIILGALLLMTSAWAPQLVVPQLIARALSAPREAVADQAPQAPGGGRGAAPSVNLPSAPTAVALPTLSEEITGPGPIFDSTPSLPPGKGLAAFRYEVKEYFVSGTANGQPYKTRLVVRRPAEVATFSGLVLAESMHGSGSAHMFEFTSTYTMSSGHAAVEILTTGPTQFTAAQPGSLQGPAGGRRPGQRDPGAGRRAGAQRARHSAGSSRARWCWPARR